MSLDPVLALLQVSTALGVLYLALPEARYRDKLFRQVVGAFKDQEVEDVGDENADVDDRIPPSLHRQTRFSDLYHKAIMTWREELPEHHDEKLEGTSAWYFPREAGRKPEEATERLPAEYQVFKSDTDIKVVFWVAVIAPILAMPGVGRPRVDTRCSTPLGNSIVAYDQLRPRRLRPTLRRLLCWKGQEDGGRSCRAFPKGLERRCFDDRSREGQVRDSGQELGPGSPPGTLSIEHRRSAADLRTSKFDSTGAVLVQVAQSHRR